MVSGGALRTCECSQARPIRFFNRLSWPGPLTPPFNEEHVGKLWSSMIIWLSHGIWGVPHFRTNPFETLFIDACKSSPGTIPRSCLDCPCPRSGSLKQSWFGARTGQRNPGQGAYVFVVVTLTCKRHYVLFPLKTVSAQIATKIQTSPTRSLRLRFRRAEKDPRAIWHSWKLDPPAGEVGLSQNGVYRYTRLYQGIPIHSQLNMDTLQ